MTQEYTITAIAHIQTPFKQKFGIPRQAGLVGVPGVIEFVPPFSQELAFEGLDQVSHIWVSFLFHQHFNAKEKLTVRPPRLGGNEGCGVFATRSSFRPNHLGLSVLKLESIERIDGRVHLHVSGVDMLDGTPIVDVKPYLPYADIVADAENRLAPDAPDKDKLKVEWGDRALEQLEAFDLIGDRQVIGQLIALDPRPAYQGDDQIKDYAFMYRDYDIVWQFDNLTVTIIEIKQ